MNDPDHREPFPDRGDGIVPWEVVPVENDLGDHRVLLPTDEEMLKRDAYVIVPSELIASLDDHR